MFSSSADREIGVFQHVAPPTRLRLEFSRVTFLPRNKRLLISWLQSPSAVILEPRKIKSDTVSTVSPSISHEANTTVQKHQFFSTQLFFIVQLSHPYMTSGKTITLTRWTIVGKVISLLFNMLSRLVITFLAKSKRLLISWLQSSSAVILEPRKIKSATDYTSICHEVMRPDAMILVF